MGLAWLAFAVLRPGSDARKSRRHIRELRRGFVDQLSRRPHLRESEYESLVYHHVSQLNNSRFTLPSLATALGRGAAKLFARGGSCARETRSDPLSQVRDNCISMLRDVMSERGVQQRP